MTYQQKEVIGNQTLYLGDCLNILPEIASVDAVVTDPPYKMEIRGGGFAKNNQYFQDLSFGTSKDFKLSDNFYSLCLNKLSEVNLIFFCNKLMKLDLENWAVSKKYKFDEILLLKTAPAPLINNQWLPDKEFAVHIFKKCKVKGNYYTKRTWFVNSNYKDKNIAHPSPKPLEIMKAIISNVSEEGKTVLDPFMGSGTTLVACQQTGRNGIGIELNNAYFQVACERVYKAFKNS